MLHSWHTDREIGWRIPFIYIGIVRFRTYTQKRKDFLHPIKGFPRPFSFLLMVPGTQDVNDDSNARERIQENHSHQEIGSRRRFIRTRLACPLVFCLCAFVLYVVNYRGFLANRFACAVGNHRRDALAAPTPGCPSRTAVGPPSRMLWAHARTARGHAPPGLGHVGHRRAAGECLRSAGLRATKPWPRGTPLHCMRMLAQYGAMRHQALAAWGTAHCGRMPT